MKSKEDRQRAILELVARAPVATQAELRRLLHERGVTADQATLSRDIRELGLVKMADRYADVGAVALPKAATMLARLVRGVEPSGNLLVVKTDPGEAGPVGLAFDRIGWTEVAGTVAGDDTLLVVVRDGSSARRLARKIMALKESPRKDTA